MGKFFVFWAAKLFIVTQPEYFGWYYFIFAQIVKNLYEYQSGQ